MAVNGLGMIWCQKCGCHEARYRIMFEEPDTREEVELNLCRMCQIMTVTTIKRCQGLFE